MKKLVAGMILFAMMLPFASCGAENPLTLYVAAGAEGGDGSEEAPFGSLEEARLAIRALGKKKKKYTSIVVEVADGNYPVKNLAFDAEDGGTKNCPVVYRAKNPGKAVLNGGYALTAADFSPVGDPEILSRLDRKAAEKVVCLSLFDRGVTAEDYGKLGAIGSYHTAARYDGDWIQDQYCELFCGGRRMTMARWPDEGFANTITVESEGYGLESRNSNHEQRADWYEIRNPESDVYRISKEMADRIASWKTTEGVWMFGYWSYDWADGSSPIGSFDREKCLLSPKFVAPYGANVDRVPFYFFNVLEELDAPGEWYLDREKGMLYFYPPEGYENGEIMLSLSTAPLIKVSGAAYLTFDGFTAEGTRGNGMELEGDHLTVSNCLIKNVGGDALLMTGSFNLASRNEITRTGRGGITIDGGDREKLVAGESAAENNLIHDWSEIYLTYCPAVTLNGVGNICRHNEIFNSPHEAITFSGNDHLIEYNDIHDVCLRSSDAGAIYSGRHWDWYGTRIQYNYIHEIGSGNFIPNGIYLDDALSGITVTGNVMVNVRGNGMLLGGGRDLDVENNLIVACGSSLVYDARAIQGVKSDTFWYAYGLASDWEILYQSPWKSRIWRKAYPQIARFTDDSSDLENPDFVPNPAYSIVVNNVGYQCRSWSVDTEVVQFSRVEIYNNPAKALKSVENEIFRDPANRDFRIREDLEEIVFADPALDPIPFGKIGRE